MSDDVNSPILAAIAGLSAKLDQFRDEFRDALRVELGRIRAELGQVRSEVMARIDRLQDRMVAHHEADVVNFGAAERARADRDDNPG